MSGHAVDARWEDAVKGAADEDGARHQRASMFKRYRGRWGGFEIAAMVLGFVLFWPVGLAVLFWILWSRRNGREVELPSWVPRIGPLTRTTGNSAFEDWKELELKRLEEEHRKLAAAQAEFQGFLDQLKRAKDREEFDSFMAARNKPA
jgi:hypothetical protein